MNISPNILHIGLKNTELNLNSVDAIVETLKKLTTPDNNLDCFFLEFKKINLIKQIFKIKRTLKNEIYINTF